MYIYNYFIRKVLRNIFNIIKEKLRGEWRYLVIDFTNYCNLRCPFCFNDWAKKEKNTIMKKEVFDKIIEIFPLIRQDIYLSCNYEPTLHPNFFDFLDMIPDHYRTKCFFTTNLSTRLSNEEIEKLSNSGVHHINISLDSLVPEIYELFRKGASFQHFISNLERLVASFSKNPNAPHIRYITMVFKQNINEIPVLLKQCKEKYLSSENEFRNSSCSSSNNWSEENDVSGTEWESLIKNLDKRNYKLNYYELKFIGF